MKTKKMLLLFFMLLTGVMNVSAATPYAVFEPDPLFYGGTLYLKADGLNGILEAGGTKVYYPPSEDHGPRWNDFVLLSKITSVFIDESFTNAHPTSCGGWFAGMYNLTRIQGLEYLNTENVTDMASMFSGCSSLTSIDLSGCNTANVTDMNGMFSDCSNLETVNMNGCNTGNVTNMSSMFKGCSSLMSITGWTTFDTGNVTKMNSMFAECTSLTVINLSGHNTENVTNMSSMFSGCSNLETVNMSGCNTGNVTNMSSMFSGCTNIGTINMSGCNTGNVTNMSSMFSGCTKLTNLDVSGFNTANVTNMSSMFKDCTKLTNLDVSGFNTANVTNTSSMFSGCYDLSSLDVSGFNTANVTDMSYMFYNCYDLSSLDVSGFNTANVTDMSYMFYNCSGLTSLDLSSFTFKNSTSTNYMLRSCTKLKSLTIPSSANYLYASACTDVGEVAQPCLLNYPIDLSIDDNVTVGSGYIKWCNGYFKENSKPYAILSSDNTNLTFYYDTSWRSRSGTVCLLNIGSKTPGWYNNRTSITSVVFSSSFTNARPPSCYCWFYGMTKLTSITGLAYLKTDNVTTMKNMFYNCSGLTSLGVSGFNTANVTDMSSMFYNCSGLTSLDVSGFNTANVTDMFSLFANCSGVSSLNVSGFNTSKVTSMQQMFLNCSGLTSLDLSSFNTSKVTNMASMFKGCTGLTSLNVSSFTTPKVTNMMDLFNGCSSVKRLDLSGFTFKSNTETLRMLIGCSGLQKLRIPSTASLLPATSCSSIGTTDNPCTLIYPNGFTPEASSSGTGWYQWKGGYFKDAEPEPYVVLSSDEKTLTFYYDVNSDNHPGMVYELNTENNNPGWFDKRASVTGVIFDSSFSNALPTTCYRWFYGMYNLTSITGIGNLKTDNVTNMGGMFMSCSQLTSLDVSGFKTEKVTNMAFMFYYCKKLTNLDVSGFKTSKVSFIQQLFDHCESLTSLDLSGFTFKSTVSTNVLLQECKSLKTLIIPSTASSLTANACSGVGSETAPCTLIYPEGFTLNVTSTGSGWYMWKSGYFKDETETYVLLSPDNTTLTFYYDNQSGNRTGTVYYLNTGDNDPGWFAYESPVTSVVFDSSFADARPTSCHYWFSEMVNLTSITGIEYLNTSEVTNMEGMFAGCSSLTSLNLSGFNTANVTSMYQMFFNCSELTSLNLSGFNTANVTNMEWMFDDCSKLTSLNLSGFNTAKVTSMYRMFAGCSSLTSLNVSGVNTEKVTNMNEMFQNCSSLTSLDVSGFNTARVRNMDCMFEDCSKLKVLNLSNFTFNHGEEDEGYSTSYLLYNCSALKALSVPATAGNLSETACVNVGTTAAPCSLVYPESFTPEATSTGSGWYEWNSGYFKDAEPEPYVVLSPDEKTLTFYYNKYQSSCPGTVYELNTGSNNPGWYDKRTSITDVVFDTSFANACPTSCYRWFYGMTNLTSITGIGYLNTSSVTNMRGMFRSCYSLTSLDVSGFNTSNVTTMYEMFYGCSGLTSLDVSGFNTANVTGFEWMFSGCSGLTSLDVSGFNTGKVNYMDNMFNSCSGLTSLDVSGFNTERVTDMSSMFSGCSGLTSLDVSGFNTAKVTDMGYMFNNCYGLTSLDVSGFNTAKVTDMTNMFYNCRGLTILDVSGFNTEKVTSMKQMFQLCFGLTSLDVSGFNTEKVTNMNNMFRMCYGLTSLDLSNFTFTSTVTSTNMLASCTGLQSLAIPISASYLNANACTYVGTATNPCTLVYPAGMTLDKTGETDTYFIWKSGYFKDAFLPGDANGDGSVSVSDVMMTVDYVLGLEPEGFHFDNANVAGGDNIVTVSDVMGIVDIALGLTISQAPPQARYSGADAIGLSATRSQCTVVLENSEPFTALEFTIVMPENATLGNAAMMTARSNGHQVKTQAVAPGRYNMMVFAPSGMPLRDGTTALLRFDFTGCQPGDIAIEGTQLVNSRYETVLPTGVVTTITGIEADGAADGQMYYNTVGIGVKKPTRGVYITNGAKIVVK